MQPFPSHSAPRPLCSWEGWGGPSKGALWIQAHRTQFVYVAVAPPAPQLHWTGCSEPPQHALCDHRVWRSSAGWEGDEGSFSRGTQVCCKLASRCHVLTKGPHGVRLWEHTNVQPWGQRTPVMGAHSSWRTRRGQNTQCFPSPCAPQPLTAPSPAILPRAAPRALQLLSLS